MAEICSAVRSIWHQLPFTVSQNPYRTANAANAQNARGTAGRDDGAWAGGCAPSPTKIATKIGASAAPSPSRALSTSPERSTQPTLLAGHQRDALYQADGRAPYPMG